MKSLLPIAVPLFLLVPAIACDAESTGGPDSSCSGAKCDDADDSGEVDFGQQVLECRTQFESAFSGEYAEAATKIQQAEACMAGAIEPVATSLEMDTQMTFDAFVAANGCEALAAAGAAPGTHDNAVAKALCLYTRTSGLVDVIRAMVELPGIERTGFEKSEVFADNECDLAYRAVANAEGTDEATELEASETFTECLRTLLAPAAIGLVDAVVRNDPTADPEQVGAELDAQYAALYAADAAVCDALATDAGDEPAALQSQACQREMVASLFSYLSFALFGG